METSNESTSPTLFDPTSFAADTPVSPSAPQASGAANTTLDTCGLMSERPLAHYDPDTQSWKTSEDISLWGDCPSLATLPPSGITRNGTLFERPLLEPLIVESGSSLWPTPTIHGEIVATRIEAHRRRLDSGMRYTSRLTQAIALAYPDDVGYLSPTWTELLMGFPPGWTDLEDSATPSSPK